MCIKRERAVGEGGIIDPNVGEPSNLFNPTNPDSREGQGNLQDQWRRHEPGEKVQFMTPSRLEKA